MSMIICNDVTYRLLRATSLSFTDVETPYRYKLLKDDIKIIGLDLREHYSPVLHRKYLLDPRHTEQFIATRHSKNDEAHIIYIVSFYIESR